MARRTCLPCLLILIAPGCAHVQRNESAVVPGLAIHFDPPANPDTIVYQRSITRAGEDSTAGIGARALSFTDERVTARHG